VSKLDRLWLFVEHGKGKTWTRADVPQSIQTVKELINYLQHGGQIQSAWIDLPERVSYAPRAVGMTVIATIVEKG